MIKVGLYAIGTSTTLESNMSLSNTHVLCRGCQTPESNMSLTLIQGLL